ncbi:MAG: cytochrome c-type biogenesis protein [Gammaproteobacteria bacterium]
MRTWVLIGACLLLVVTRVAWAIDSEPPFSDPVMEHRYEHLLQEIRCLQCMDENIANSDAPLAADFRRQIHAMVAEGRSEQQIRQYMVNRYGDFVLYDPPLQASTWLLWTGPFLLLGIAILVVILVVRRRARMDEGREI